MTKYIKLLGLSFLFVSTIVFSQEQEKEKLEEYIEYLTDDSLLGRKAGEEGELKAAMYFSNMLKSFGITLYSPENGQEFLILNGKDSLRSRNVIGIIEGYDQELRDEFILLGVNYDHIGVNVLDRDGKQELQIFPGANSNASGVASTLLLAEEIAKSAYLFRRSILIVGFGSKEQSMAGSWYFVNKGFPFIDKVKLMINLDMVGKKSQGNSLKFYTGMASASLTKSIQETSNNFSVVPPSWLEGRVPSSDFVSFYERSIPFILFTSGLDVDLYTVNDVKENLDYDAMLYYNYYLYNLLMHFANKDNIENDLKGADTEQNEPSNENEGRVYSPYEVDKLPTFLGGDEKRFLNDWVYTYLRYPEIAVKRGTQGIVVVEFVIEPSGELTNASIVDGESEALEQEALRVINASPRWKAGEIAGKKVRVRYTIAVEYRLEKSE